MKLKSLSRLKDLSRGPIHRLEIHPAQRTGRGKRAFVTRTLRDRSPAAQQAIDQGGAYTPEPAAEESVHDDQQGMLAHVGKAFGIAPEDDGDGD